MKIRDESPEEHRATQRLANSIGAAFTGVTIAILGHEILDYFNTSGENPISLKALGAAAFSGFGAAAFFGGSHQIQNEIDKIENPPTEEHDPTEH